MGSGDDEVVGEDGTAAVVYPAAVPQLERYLVRELACNDEE